MRSSRLALSIPLLVLLFLFYHHSLKGHAHHTIPQFRSSRPPTSSSASTSFFAFNSPFALFPPSAAISLIDDNSTFFPARPAAFGPSLHAHGLVGQLWIGGFHDHETDTLAETDGLGVFYDDAGELGCSDIPGWSPWESLRSGHGRGVTGSQPSQKTKAQKDHDIAEKDGNFRSRYNLEKDKYTNDRFTNDKYHTRPAPDVKSKKYYSSSSTASRQLLYPMGASVDDHIGSSGARQPASSSDHKSPVPGTDAFSLPKSHAKAATTDTNADMDTDDGTDDHVGSVLALSQNVQGNVKTLLESGEIEGKIVLLRRGGCGFLEKVMWAQRRGAKALIVGDDRKGGPLVQMYARGDTSNVTIPSVFTSRTTAHLLASLLHPTDPEADSLSPKSLPLLRTHSKTPKSSSSQGIQSSRRLGSTLDWQDVADLGQDSASPLTCHFEDLDSPLRASALAKAEVWVTITLTGSDSSLMDTFIFMVVSPLITLSIVYTMLMVRSRIRRRRWRAPKSIIDQLPVRTYQAVPFIATPLDSDDEALPKRPRAETRGAADSDELDDAISGKEPASGHEPASRTDCDTTSAPSHSTHKVTHHPEARPDAHPESSSRTHTHAEEATDSTPLLGPTAPCRTCPSCHRRESQWKKYMTRQVECAVCLEDYVDGVSRVMSLPCGHEFHVDCIVPWLTTRKRTCPICKGDVMRSLRAGGRPSSPRYEPFLDSDSEDDVDDEDAHNGTPGGHEDRNEGRDRQGRPDRENRQGTRPVSAAFFAGDGDEEQAIHEPGHSPGSRHGHASNGAETPASRWFVRAREWLSFH